MSPVRVPPRQSLGHWSRAGVSDPARPLLDQPRPAPLQHRVNTTGLDVRLLVSSGAMELPPRRPAPRAVTVSLRQRLHRWLRVRLGWLLYR